MKKILLSLLTITSFGLTAQNVNIPDANFKAYLVGNSAINTNADTEIQITEAAAFSGTIDCHGMSISDLTGIEAFTSLDVLQCYDNQLTSLNVVNNMALTSLRIYNNQISSLNVSTLTQLVTLQFQNNNISGLDLSSNTNLVQLWCNDNQLTSLDVSNNSALTLIYCHNNQISTLDVANCSALTDLRVYGNQLTHLNIANGNNTILTSLLADSNPNLSCIQVDDVIYANANLAGNIDPASSFGTVCAGSNNVIVYVDENATGNNDGTSWTDAYSNLFDATSNGNSDAEIWVAQGTYKPHNGDNSRQGAFVVHSEMYGGFNGTETQRSQRDWIANPTILSGDLGVVGDPEDNSYTIVFAATSDRVIIDGFTISDGYADGTVGSNRYGAGIYIDNNRTPVLIKNCIIKDNMANSDVGVYCVFPNSGVKSVTIENTRFSNNYGRWGTAITISATNGRINGNMINCLFDNNKTGAFPMSSGNAGQTMPAGRFASSGSGSVYGRLINCTFTQNEDGGAFDDMDKSVFGVQGNNSTVEIHNTIFWENVINPNHSSIGFGNNAGYTPNSVTVFNTISADVMDNASYITSTNNAQVNPVFSNSAANDFTLQTGSSAINAGVSTGISDLIPSIDLAGNNRFDGAIDLGCYEYQGSASLNEQNQNFSVIVYPNPTSHLLTIQNTELEIESIEIIDYTGKRIVAVNSNAKVIDVSHLANGVYFLNIYTSNGVINSKFIKE